MQKNDTEKGYNDVHPKLDISLHNFNNRLFIATLIISIIVLLFLIISDVVQKAFNLSDIILLLYVACAVAIFFIYLLTKGKTSYIYCFYIFIFCSQCCCVIHSSFIKNINDFIIP